MTQRERFIKSLTFKSPDKITFDPGHPRESTLKVWRQQGLPEGVDYREALFDVLGIEPESVQQNVSLDIIMEMRPTFEEKVLEHKDGHYVVQDWMGAITEISDEFDYTFIRSPKDFVTRKWHKFPVETREDWEEVKRRYDPETPGRFPPDFVERCKRLENRDYVTSVNMNGPFWQLREWLGFENLCIKFIEEPDFIREMINFWTEYTAKMLEKVVKHITLDAVNISEDMAYKAHSMISPQMTREFLLPSYKRWVKIIKDSGCPIIDMDSDGYVAELIPIWIEAGINVCDPMEVAAHNDIVEYRNLYGTGIAYRGGIDKRAIAAGGQVMVDEVMRVVPPLLKDGGFIPGCDHGVPFDISWPNYVEYSRLLAKLTGWL